MEVIQPLNIAANWVVWVYWFCSTAMVSMISMPTIRTVATQNLGSLRMEVFSFSSEF